MENLVENVVESTETVMVCPIKKVAPVLLPLVAVVGVAFIGWRIYKARKAKKAATTKEETTTEEETEI